jgi:hypothetical protein
LGYDQSGKRIPEINCMISEMRIGTTERLRVIDVRTLFVETHPHKCTADDVLRFYGWLIRHRADLLPTGPGDTYQQLKFDLAELFEE